MRTLFVLHPFYRTITNKGGLDADKGVKTFRNRKISVRNSHGWDFWSYKEYFGEFQTNDRVFL